MAEGSAASKKKASQNDKKQRTSFLKKRVDIPSKGVLSKNARVPKPLRAIGGYFGGSFRELRQVSWPNRRNAWSLTLAVILFTLVLAIIILLLDFGFEQLFKRILL